MPTEAQRGVRRPGASCEPPNVCFIGKETLEEDESSWPLSHHYAPPKTCIPLRKHFKRPQENQITIPYISVAGNIEQLLGTLFKENQVENQL